MIQMYNINLGNSGKPGMIYMHGRIKVASVLN
jgi:hypothetical protein